MKTNIGVNSGIEINEQIKALMKDMPSVEPEDIADAVVYVLSTPAHVQVHELLVHPVGERF